MEKNVRECAECGHCRDCGYFHTSQECRDPDPKYDGSCLCSSRAVMREYVAVTRSAAQAMDRLARTIKEAPLV